LLLAAFAALVVVAACSANLMKVEDIPVPPTARKGVIEGSYEVKLRTDASQVLKELKEKYGKAETQIYFLDSQADWASVTGFYDERLGPLDLKRDASMPQERAGFKMAVWSRDGWLDKKAVAAALIEARSTPDGRPQKFLAVFRAGD
jgi:hypothetical protein